MVEEEHIDLKTVISKEVEKYYGHVAKQRGQITEQLSNGTFDVLKWWKENSKSFPNIAQTVRYILCVPATSVNCEWAFSSANDICTKKINKLSDKSVQILTFLRSNYESIPQHTSFTEIPEKNIPTNEFFEEDQ